MLALTGGRAHLARCGPAATKAPVLKTHYCGGRIFCRIALLADCCTVTARFSRIAVPDRTLLVSCSCEAIFGVHWGQLSPLLSGEQEYIMAIMISSLNKSD
jgi:hypothetical protein